MINFTVKNYRKAAEIVKTYGYTNEKQIENITINCFILARRFGYKSVENFIAERLPENK